MNIVAFLQNQWFHDPARVQATIDAQPAEERARFRQRFATRALFAGCLTGRRLRQCLGAVLCEKIYWENASLEMGDVSSALFKPDIAHIQSVLAGQQPDLVIAFGRHASDALRDLVPEESLVLCPHPAARGEGTVESLKQLRADLERRIAVSDFT